MLSVEQTQTAYTYLLAKQITMSQTYCSVAVYVWLRFTFFTSQTSKTQTAIRAKRMENFLDKTIFEESKKTLTTTTTTRMNSQSYPVPIFSLFVVLRCYTHAQ